MPADDEPTTGGPEAEPAEPGSARSRFLTGALLAIGAAAVFLLGALFLGLRDEGEPTRAPAWSAWAPTRDGAAGASQIAAHVGPQYRAPGGTPLVSVKAGALEVAGLPLTVAVRPPAASGGEVQRYGEGGVLYRLCGLGKDCAIATGEPSIQRHLLLRREALELALYSFRYLDDVEQVAVFMPPRRGDQPSQALFFRRDQVASEIEKPLEATLVDRTPSVARVTRSPDALLVERLTIPTLFRFSVKPAGGDDRAVLVLDPFQAQAPVTPQPPSSSNGSGRSDA